MAVLEASANDLAELLSGSPQWRAEARTVLEDSGLQGCGHLASSLTTELLSRLP